MQSYFNDCKTVQDTKTTYRFLAFKFHPDTGGDKETMQEINELYHLKLKSFDGAKFVGFDKKDHYYRYNHDVEQELMNKIQELLGLRLDGVTIELVGIWIWIHGDTKTHKDQLKKAKCQWHSKRNMWYFRKFSYRRKYSGAAFDTLHMMYGSNVYEEQTDQSLKIA